MSELQDFYHELFQDILRKSSEEGVYKEDAFFDVFTERLVETGEFDVAERAFFCPVQGGVRVDGYCGDPITLSIGEESSRATLGLIVLDFNQDQEVVTLTAAEMQRDFRRVEAFLKRSLEMSFRNSLELTDPGYGLADLISVRWPKIARVKIYLLTNKKLSIRVDGKESGEIDGREIVYSVWDITRYRNLVASGREREELHINFEALPSGPLHALLASKADDERQVFLAAVPGIDLAHI